MFEFICLILQIAKNSGHRLRVEMLVFLVRRIGPDGAHSFKARRAAPEVCFEACVLQ